MQRPNDDLRERAQKKGVYLWQIAERLGVHPSTLSVHLRRELNRDEEKTIGRIIDEIAKDRG